MIRFIIFIYNFIFYWFNLTKIPTQAGKIDLLKATAVLNPISYGVILALSGLVEPGVTIFGLYNIPSKNKLFSTKAYNKKKIYFLNYFLN